MGDKWDESKFSPNDPRNIMIDPDAVIQAYIEKVEHKYSDKTKLNVCCLVA